MDCVHKTVLAFVIFLLLGVPADYTEGMANVNKKESLGAKTIVPPSPVWIIGTYDKEGKPNMMTASWVGVCCSKPPCVAISLREATHTHGNIKENKAYTVNIPSEELASVAAYAGTVSGRDTDKFEVTGMTPVESELVNAPYVDEFPLIIECRLLKIIEIGLHTMFIGEIMDVKSDKSILGKNGTPDPGKLKPLIFNYGGWGFFGIGDQIGGVTELARQAKK